MSKALNDLQAKAKATAEEARAVTLWANSASPSKIAYTLAAAKREIARIAREEYAAAFLRNHA